MRRAVCLIRAQPHYRLDAFFMGLEAAGFRIVPSLQKPASDDVLVIWNRYSYYDKNARDFEAAGATVLIVENGWIGADGDGRHLFAICRSHHNGAGTWFVGDDDRWSRLGLELQPWRRDGRHILVLPQRGIGEPGVAMPREWPGDVLRRLAAATDRPVKIRKHPGKDHTPLEPDLEGCFAAVTWASGAGIKAIVAGIPVFHDLPSWIGAPAARFGVDGIEDPFLGDRLPMLHRLAWAQWTPAEIASGEPFRCLLR